MIAIAQRFFSNRFDGYPAATPLSLLGGTTSSLALEFATTMRIDARMRIVTLVCAVAALTTAPGGVSCARIPTQTEADINVVTNTNADDLQKAKPVKFSYNDCGATKGDTVAFKSLSLTPSPIVWGENVTFSADVALKTALPASAGGDLSVSLTVKRRILGKEWVKMPCVDNVGSCKVTGLCAKLSKELPPSQPCPYGLPACRCPFAASEYDVPLTSLFVPVPPSLPSWLEDSSVYVEAIAHDESDGGKEVACLELYFSLSK